MAIENLNVTTMNNQTSQQLDKASMALSDQIEYFDNIFTEIWEQVWGAHMHHGYYGPDGKNPQDPRQAQTELVEQLIQWAQIQNAHNILDVGCGIGGSTLHLAEKFKATATGITLSPVQVNRAIARSHELGLSAQSKFVLGDAMQMPFEDNSFDLVWCLDIAEHMPNKALFLRECCRVLQPGGKLMLSTTCHRPCKPGESLSEEEQKNLKQICQAFNLSHLITLSGYEDIVCTLPLTQVCVADWTDAVAPHWSKAIMPPVSLKLIRNIIKAGVINVIRGSLISNLMAKGYRQGLVHYGLLCGIKS